VLTLILILKMTSV